ncbi:zinc finger protein 131-like [Pyrgilauda ruficollis]|uniref:zinc finger protein 131-like n=1 Tax=Pyrgilauda ruficollis TaxID=221976 RepID=UPI001B871736|nr:zinc finger protein 131-like [Pyrgilauda ruficollis]
MEAEEIMECIQEFPEHYKVILDRLNEQREQDQFTDITLIVDGHHFKAHKAVLAACSQFFYKFFQDFTQEPLVEIEGVSNMAFRHLIEFTYTAKLMVQGEEEANDVWKAAEYLQMLEAIKALEIRNKENSSPLESKQRQGKNKAKKRKIAETSNVITETLPSAESEPVEIEVEIAEGTIEAEDDSIETLEVASAEQSIKYIHTTGTSDESALALLADITSKYRQGETKCQIQEGGATDPSCKQEHMKTHSSESYKCDICNKSYLRESALKQHLTCHHLDEGGASKKQRPGKKIHICQYCDKQFDHFGHFKEHLRKHTGKNTDMVLYNHNRQGALFAPSRAERLPPVASGGAMTQAWQPLQVVVVEARAKRRTGDCSFCKAHGQQLVLVPPLSAGTLWGGGQGLVAMSGYCAEKWPGGGSPSPGSTPHVGSGPPNG